MAVAWVSAEATGAARRPASDTARAWEEATHILTAASIPGFLADGGPRASARTVVVPARGPFRIHRCGRDLRAAKS
jgi:hypothetical protein